MDRSLKGDEVNIMRYTFCFNCEAKLTSADDEAGCCTQCETRLPRLRQLLLRIVDGYIDDPGTSDLDDEQPIRARLDLGDWRLAKQLLAG